MLSKFTTVLTLVAATTNAANLRSTDTSAAAKTYSMEEVRAEVNTIVTNPQTVVTSTHVTQLRQHLSDIAAAINTEQEDSELAAMAMCKRTHDDPTSSKSAPALSSGSAAYAGLGWDSEFAQKYIAAISSSQLSGCNKGSTCLTKSNAAHTALGTFFYLLNQMRSQLLDSHPFIFF